jgi:hypothetical protein
MVGGGSAFDREKVKKDLRDGTMCFVGVALAATQRHKINNHSLDHGSTTDWRW